MEHFKTYKADELKAEVFLIYFAALETAGK